ncbi:MAG: GreA/GreB family elongation factor [Alphaproteobacteria bacterium]|nr:GreA/GreB family elongation factor [Alphaproteobacteria bacterium]
MTRARVLEVLRDTLSRELDALGRATAMARDEATSAESRPENQYDTRALEASYLAAGQGERLEDLKRLVAWAETLGSEAPTRVEAGALVELEDDRGRSRTLLVAPRGGMTLDVDGCAISVVSASSPLGSALGGLTEGDEEEVDSPDGVACWTVLALR